jgi:hypothetical protein
MSRKSLLSCISFVSRQNSAAYRIRGGRRWARCVNSSSSTDLDACVWLRGKASRVVDVKRDKLSGSPDSFYREARADREFQEHPCITGGFSEPHYFWAPRPQPRPPSTIHLTFFTPMHLERFHGLEFYLH